MSLKDKTIVVTGGSRGLGLGLVEALVDQGAKVTVVARGADALGFVSARLASLQSPPTLRTRPPPTVSLPKFARTFLCSTPAPSHGWVG